MKTTGFKSGCELVYYWLCESVMGLLFINSSSQVKEGKPSLLGILKEIWDFYSKIYLEMRTERCQIFLVQTFNVNNKV
jgi:hypothetical protein